MVHDPATNADEARHEYWIALTTWEKLPPTEAIVVAVARRESAHVSPERLGARLCRAGTIVNVKGVLPEAALASEMHAAYWRL